MKKCKKENLENVNAYEGEENNIQEQWMKTWEEQSEKFEKDMKFEKFIEKVFGISFLLLFIIYVFFLDIRPYFIEGIPVKKSEVIISILSALVVAFFTSAIIYISLLKIYENKEKLRFFWIIFSIVMIVFAIKIPYCKDLVKKELITHEQYLEAIDTIEVNNEAELAERVEEYYVIDSVDSNSNIKMYTAKFYGHNYTADVTYNEDFSIKKSEFTFYDVILPALVISFFLIVLALPTFIFCIFSLIVDLVFIK